MVRVLKEVAVMHCRNNALFAALCTKSKPPDRGIRKAGKLHVVDHQTHFALRHLNLVQTAEDAEGS